jgi:hypothetical protein
MNANKRKWRKEARQVPGKGVFYPQSAQRSHRKRLGFEKVTKAAKIFKGSQWQARGLGRGMRAVGAI